MPTQYKNEQNKKNKKMSELYKLPAGWKWKKLESISLITSGYAFKSTDFNQNDGIKSIKITNVGVKEFVRDSYFLPIGLAEKLSKFRVLSGDIVIALTRPYISNGLKIATVPIDYDKAFLNQRVASIRSMINKSINAYVYYYLSTNNILKEVKELSRTLNQPNLSVKELSLFKIPLPPLAEQKRIVAKLDSLFEKIDKAIELHQQNITNANTLMASTLDKTFKKLEGEYSIKTLNDACEKITDGTHSSPKATNVGYPYITVKDIDENGRIDFDNCLSINQDDFFKLKSGNCAPAKNDVLFSKDGTVGKVSVVDFEKDFVVLSSLAILRPNKDMNSYYLFYVMKSPNFFDFAQSKKTGAAIKRVVLRTIKEFEIPLPPLPIQQQTVEYLDSIATKVDKIKQLNEQKLENLKALKASILDKAFRGEL